MAGNIFISYRRDDAAAWAGRLHMALERQFRREQIFMDVDSIQAGLDFAKVIDAEVAKCDVMLVVIGKGWLNAADAAGRRRLDDPGDFVRLEVESALRRDIRVVPVLVDGASLPKAEELLEGMQGLVRRQAWPLSHARFGAESEGLIEEISRYVTPAGGAAAAPPRTDWVAEASWFSLLSMAGLGFMFFVGVSWIGPFSGQHDSIFEMGFWFMLTFVAAVGAFLAPQWIKVGKLTALWLCSAAAAFMVFGFGLDRSEYAVAKKALESVSAIYFIASGPALILWRRRKRGG